jgi:hypothetical protein
MSSLLENTREELARLRDELTGRLPGRQSRAEGRARRTARRAEQVGRRARSALRSGLNDARDFAEERIQHTERLERRRRRRTAGATAAAGAAGGAGAYFLDPNQGKRRRHVARDRARALFRRAEARLGRAGRYGAHTATGKAQGVVAGVATTEKPAPSDEALADRVRSEIFRPEDAPKESVNVNVEGGVVYLRGATDDPKQARKLVKGAKSVNGVREVRSLINTR